MTTLQRLRCLALFIAITIAMPLVATATPPSDADVNRLLSVSRMQAIHDSMIPQLETMEEKQFDQMAAKHTLSTEEKAKMVQILERSKQRIRKAMSWSELEPVYIDLYKHSFSREDVLAMTKFYESSAGQSLLDKTPVLMQNLMVAIQKKMAPLTDDLMQDLEKIDNAPKQDHKK
ncbi:DUF2059 domain-containing protein [Xylella fastidiosa]|jgi:hypothetical protein|uniref:DUF2059 domain-containing protein n=5 Tax=Xylella fastidiosa TaxID=2371 RepID=Q87EY6_XYLFT|nr:conserved hypothetical protein [Xylella fastidiosa 9a5c]AAO28053.1 conserved hypothetical protein [Xylella fastidiosa Temecula1]ACB91604.1 conserved hypothetical protein [Xylella fastidiosa M23]ADN63151.1 hypothetical protein XFLM_06085 [Xylella fastidiosa subsp. fastidiosa GB514]AIC13237.1 hypothetical protein P303_11100 [Xylella fastidiosa MUL0034]ALQ93928.1 hypothetical protein XFUD_00835 [Xylella fastidiosa]EGO80934.1 hypothetical protein XFEB_02298 [Xylella fastidiosa EB92.1]ETE35868